MKKSKKVILIIILIIVGVGLLTGGYFAYKHFFKTKEVTNVANTVDTIKGFDYKLEDRDTELYKKEFQALKKNLESDDIDYEAYASSIAKMYIIDLYTMSNKINKYDIGGAEFIHSKALENYKLKVEDTIYKYLDDNSYNDREQVLPEISDITIDDIEESTYTIACQEDDEDCEEEELDSYEITLSWSFVEDLDYDTEAVIIAVKEGNKLVIVEQKAIEEE